MLAGGKRAPPDALKRAPRAGSVGVGRGEGRETHRLRGLRGVLYRRGLDVINSGLLLIRLGRRIISLHLCYLACANLYDKLIRAQQ